MKQLKRAGAVLLCMIVTICMLMPVGVRAEEEENREPKGLNQITLSVGDGQKTPVYKAGAEAELKIDVLNKGNVDAQNVTIAPVISSTDEWPFDMDKLNYEQSLGTISAGSKTTALWGGGDDKLTVRPDVTGKSYKLTFRLTYDDGDKLYEADRYVFVKTEAEKSTSDSGNSDKGQGDPQPGGPADKNENSSTGKDQTGDSGSGGGGGGSAASSGKDSYDGGIYNGDPVSAGGGSSGSGDGSVPRVIVRDLIPIRGQ